MIVIVKYLCCSCYMRCNLLLIHPVSRRDRVIFFSLKERKKANFELGAQTFYIFVCMSVVVYL